MINPESNVPALPESEQDKMTREMERKAEFALGQLSIPVGKIMEKLTSLLESGEIELIVGDDASGRIPTAIFREIFRMAYKEKGFAAPKIIYIAGSKFLEGEEKKEKKEKIIKYLERVKKEMKKTSDLPMERALVVTDLVVTGVSLDPVMEALHEMGVQIKAVASISVKSNEEEIRELEERWSAPLFFGLDHSPAVYASDALSGVIKKPNDLFAAPFVRPGVVGRFGETGNQKIINKTRELGNALAEEAYQNWKEAHPKKNV
ncbi:MAG: hypothetical protein WC878_06685 [Candidatus Paceibacterota bacterium]|jgi:adenine/guanine phosphoribosyltransferase-like PRPP-binding protein